MKKTTMAIVVVLLLSTTTCIAFSDSVSSQPNETTYQYSDVNSYYYNGKYVRITESIEVNDTGIDSNGNYFSYDLLKTEYLTYPNSDESYVTMKYFNDGTLVFIDSREYRNNDSVIEADVDGEWQEAISINNARSTNSVFGFLVSTLAMLSLTNLVGVVVIISVATYVLVEEGINSNPDPDVNKNRTTRVSLSEDIELIKVNDVPNTISIGNITAPALEFKDENLKKLDAFVYYFVCKSTIMDEEGNDTFIFPIAFDLNLATEVMMIDSELYNVWTAFGDWAETPCERMYGLNTWKFHKAEEDFEMFDHYHGQQLDGSISNSMSYYGFAWGALYESDDPENQQQPKR